MMSSTNNNNSSTSPTQSEHKEQILFDIVQQGFYGVHPTDVHILYLTSDKDAIAAGIKNDIVVATDFSNDVLVYVASGSKPTGGYSIVIKKVVFDSKRKKLDVYARDKEPKSQFGTMATTQPFVVLRVPKRAVDKSAVHWAKKKLTTADDE